MHRWWERTLDCTAAANNNMLMFATSWMDLEIVVLSEVSQTKKDKYRMIAFFFPLAALDLHCCEGFFFSSCGEWGTAASHCGGVSFRSKDPRARGLSTCGSRALEYRLCSCGPQAWLLRDMRDLPGPGIVPLSPALAGGSFTSELYQ